MNNADLNLFLILGGVFGILFFALEFIYLKFKLPAELTRKFMHFVSGTVCAIWIIHFESHLPVLILSLLFYAILGFGKLFHFMRCIHDVKRKSYGGVIFPLTIYLIFLLNKIADAPPFYFQVSILVLSISDPLAAFGGILLPVNGKFNNGLNHVVQSESKTRIGSLLFLLSSLTITIIALLDLSEYSATAILVFALIVSVVSTVTEAFSKKGLDNLLVPLTIWLIFFLA